MIDVRCGRKVMLEKRLHLGMADEKKNSKMKRDRSLQGHEHASLVRRGVEYEKTRDTRLIKA